MFEAKSLEVMKAGEPSRIHRKRELRRLRKKPSYSVRGKVQPITGLLIQEQIPTCALIWNTSRRFKSRTQERRKAMVKGVGSCQLDCYGQDGIAKKITLTQVLYVPDLDMNLVSVGQLVAKGARVIFDQSGCTIAREDRVAAVAVQRNGLYHLRMVERSNAMKVECCEKECIHDWYKKLGHRDFQAIQDLDHRQLATGIKIRNCGTKITCETCLAGKFARLPFPKKVMKKSVAVMDLVHTDLCGPMRTATPGGRRYFLTLIDDHSRYTVLYLLREKSELLVQLKIMC